MLTECRHKLSRYFIDTVFEAAGVVLFVIIVLLGSVIIITATIINEVMRLRKCKANKSSR